MQRTTAPNHSGNMFQDGGPAGTNTIIAANDQNAHQEELVKQIEKLRIPLSASNDQIAQNLVSNNVLKAAHHGTNNAGYVVEGLTTFGASGLNISLNPGRCFVGGNLTTYLATDTNMTGILLTDNSYNYVWATGTVDAPSITIDPVGIGQPPAFAGVGTLLFWIITGGGSITSIQALQYGRAFGGTNPVFGRVSYSQVQSIPQAFLSVLTWAAGAPFGHASNVLELPIALAAGSTFIIVPPGLSKVRLRVQVGLEANDNSDQVLVFVRQNGNGTINGLPRMTTMSDTGAGGIGFPYVNMVSSVLNVQAFDLFEVLIYHHGSAPRDIQADLTYFELEALA